MAVSPFSGLTQGVTTSFFDVIIDGVHHVQDNSTLAEAIALLMSCYSDMPTATTYVISNGGKSVNFASVIASSNAAQLTTYYNAN